MRETCFYSSANYPLSVCQGGKMLIENGFLYIFHFFKTEPLNSPIETRMRNGENMRKIEGDWFAFKERTTMYLIVF